MSLAFFTGQPGILEVLAVLFVILLLFGAKKLPQLSRSLGKSLSEFKKGREEGEKPETKSELKQSVDD
ncbi:twin-arginine translocase TatA/TatE family subunit [PVC group bacterium]|nr:twin-arginine translocase TatA/TatE family subunit [PVC group bacterium]